MIRLPEGEHPIGTRVPVDESVRAVLRCHPESYWLRTERYWELIEPRMISDRFRHFWRDVWFGLALGFPVCCVLRYAFDSLDDAAMPGNSRGGRHTSAGELYVPCGIFHRRTD